MRFAASCGVSCSPPPAAACFAWLLLLLLWKLFASLAAAAAAAAIEPAGGCDVALLPRLLLLLEGLLASAAAAVAGVPSMLPLLLRGEELKLMWLCSNKQTSRTQHIVTFVFFMRCEMHSTISVAMHSTLSSVIHTALAGTAAVMLCARHKPTPYAQTYSSNKQTVTLHTFHAPTYAHNTVLASCGANTQTHLIEHHAAAAERRRHLAAPAVELCQVHARQLRLGLRGWRVAGVLVVGDDDVTRAGEAWQRIGSEADGGLSCEFVSRTGGRAQVW